MQTFALAFTKLPEAHLSSCLQPLLVPLSGSTAFKCIQLGIVHTLAGGVLNPITQATNNTLNSTGPEAESQRDTTNNQAPI